MVGIGIIEKPSGGGFGIEGEARRCWGKLSGGGFGVEGEAEQRWL